MSDTSKHLNPDESGFFESALGRRLLGRATEPLGMIDVRWAEEKYLRIVRWLGRCTALVDHLSRRYGIEDASAYGDRPFANHPRGAQLNISNTIQTFLSAGLSANLSPGSLPGAEARSNTSQSSQREAQQIQREAWKDVRPSGLADILAERSANPVVKPSSSSEGTFRISRRPPRGLLESDAPQISRPAATPMKDAKGDWVSTRSEQITQHMPFRNKVNEERIANVARPTNARELDGPRVTPAAANERGGPTSSDATSLGATSSDSVSSVATSSIFQRETPGGSRAHARPAGDAVKNRREDASAPSKLHSLPLVTPTIVRQQTERVPSPEPGARPRVRFDDAIAQDGRRSQGSSASIASIASSASSIPSRTDAFESRDESSNAEKPDLVLRRGDRETDAALATAAALPVSAKTLPGVSSTAVASEIPGESVNTERPELVLREQQAEQQMASSRTKGTRSVESSGGAQSGPNEFPPAASTPSTTRDAQTDSPSSYQAQARELQVEDISPRVIRSISERVMRAITLDLKLERERRGVTKWR